MLCREAKLFFRYGIFSKQMSWQKNQLGEMFRGSDLNYTAAITTKCLHILQIVLENKMTLEYP